MIVKDLHPIRSVECEGFRSLMNYLEPGYVIPSRKQFAADITLKHTKCQEVLKEHLKNEAKFITLTTDSHLDEYSNRKLSHSNCPLH